MDSYDLQITKDRIKRIGNILRCNVSLRDRIKLHREKRGLELLIEDEIYKQFEVAK